MLLGTHHSIHFLLLISLHWVEVCVWTVGIEDLVAVHDGDEVLGVGEVDDVVRIAREHDDGLNVVATYLIVENLGIRVGFVSQLNESMTAYDCEVLKLGVVPVLALGDTGLGDVDADLTMGEGVEEFGEAASGIYVHLVIVDGLLLGEV